MDKPSTPQRERFPFVLFFVAIFFVWLVKTSLYPPLPKSGEPALLYSNQARQNLHHTLVYAIEKAHRSIYLVMFGLTDPVLFKTLSKKIEKQIPTEIYYDPKGSPDIRKKLGQKEGIYPLKGRGLMHQKILVLDEETVFIGSANFTPSSLKMHDNLLLGLAHRGVAEFLKTHAPKESGHLLTQVGGQELSLWLLPDPNGKALSELKRRLRHASDSIYCSLFTFTHKVLAEELIRAQKRGVKVSVVVDLYSGLGASAPTVAFLKKEGINVLLSPGPQLLHHKFALIDDKTLVMGSANWTQAAFTKNNDCLLFLSQLTPAQKRVMHLVWSRVSQTANIP